MPINTAEFYFIGVMMFLILVVCTVTVFFFARQYKKEMKQRAEAAKLKAAKRAAPAEPDGGTGETNKNAE